MTLRGRDIEYGGPVVRWEDIKRGRESKGVERASLWGSRQQGSGGDV